MTKNIIIATGGTGGHVFPAMSVAKTFIDNGYDVNITTDVRGEKFLSNSGLKYTVISCGYNIKKIKSIFNIFRGFIQSLFFIKKHKPDAIIGFGSYTTLPILFVAKFFKIPIFLHDGNVFIGKTNKLFLDNAINIFTSFQEIYGVNIKYSDKICFTGAVTRTEIKEYCNNIYKYPDDGKLKILITGGSGGASFFSYEFLKIFNYFDKDLKSNIKIYHQVKTEKELEDVQRFYGKVNIRSEVKLFFNDMPKKMFESDFIVCRSGIGTISEVSMIGRACVMVPSPNVANDHQLYNAKFYNKSNACILVEEKKFVPENTAKMIIELLKNKNSMETLANNIKSMAVLDANEKIFSVVNDYLIDKKIG